MQVRAVDDPKVESVLHPQNTRASRRAHEAATAHSAVLSRRPVLALGTAVVVALGVALTAGVAAAPAAGADEVVKTTAATASPRAEDQDEAATALRAGRSSLAYAETLNAEVAASGLDLGGVPPVVETAALEEDVDRLADLPTASAIMSGLTAGSVEVNAEEVASATAELREALDLAQEKKAAEDAAAAAAAQAAAEAEAQAAAQAAALASANTVDGAKSTARSMAASQYGWGDDQFSCLSSLWQKESSWNYQAYNPSGATGIPQALPGSKMASAGGDWQTNAATQIAWGLGYIDAVYGSPCSAWSHSQSMNWY